MYSNSTPQYSDGFKKADDQLAMSDIDTQKNRSSCPTATVYDVDGRTLRRRSAGVVSQLDCHPNSKKLTRTEEEVIVQHILDLDQRGFPPMYAAVRDMANKLLVTRGVGQVGQKRPSDFVSIQTLSRRISTEHMVGRELYVRIQY
jgi:hypothetical protein